ncbi:hypothetical protein EOD42_16750 [Rhodovarius crocodyli]|uniref:Uncharacterized protein n=1 Tax=Rhodovarius crocodyli TaxID=1979269 RepID=A0A437MC63_9PROT|nr:hypothetical protein [Rhodovarius crocodyli]RVT95234.1 hypothetical protein EOD42_16750 [Rhodovarius crocodyli]
MKRRSFFGLTAGLFMSPGIVSATSIMPVKSVTPVADMIERLARAGAPLPPGFWIPERPMFFERGLYLFGSLDDRGRAVATISFEKLKPGQCMFNILGVFERCGDDHA